MQYLPEFRCPRQIKWFSGTATSIGQENCLMCLYREFTTEIGLVISLDDRFTIGPLAADNKH